MVEITKESIFPWILNKLKYGKKAMTYPNDEIKKLVTAEAQHYHLSQTDKLSVYDKSKSISLEINISVLSPHGFCIGWKMMKHKETYKSTTKIKILIEVCTPDGNIKTFRLKDQSEHSLQVEDLMPGIHYKIKVQIVRYLQADGKPWKCILAENIKTVTLPKKVKGGVKSVQCNDLSSLSTLVAQASITKQQEKNTKQDLPKKKELSTSKTTKQGNMKKKKQKRKSKGLGTQAAVSDSNLASGGHYTAFKNYNSSCGSQLGLWDSKHGPTYEWNSNKTLTDSWSCRNPAETHHLHLSHGGSFQDFQQFQDHSCNMETHNQALSNINFDGLFYHTENQYQAKYTNQNNCNGLPELNTYLSVIQQRLDDYLSFYENIQPFNRYAGARYVLSIPELLKLHEKAQIYINTPYNAMTQIEVLYRNKPRPYYEDIFAYHCGLMHPYDKDFNGDPGCPINGNIEGLFFSGKVTPNGHLPAQSPFGNTRFIIPATHLFNYSSNLYFADFYCNNKKKNPHYVTLVITKPGSKSDIFCQRYLPELDKFNNPYLCLHFTGLIISQMVWVEILYTETVDLNLETNLNGAIFNQVGIIGKGSSSAMGIPKNSKCKTCNI